MWHASLRLRDLTEAGGLGPEKSLLLLLYAMVLLRFLQFGLQLLVLLHELMDFLLVSLLQRLHYLFVLVPKGQELFVSLLDLRVVLLELKLQSL